MSTPIITPDVVTRSRRTPTHELLERAASEIESLLRNIGSCRCSPMTSSQIRESKEIVAALMERAEALRIQAFYTVTRTGQDGG